MLAFLLCLLSSPLAKYWPLQCPDRTSTKRRARSPTCRETELGGGSKKGLAEPWEFNSTCRVSAPPASRDSFCSCRYIAGSQCSYLDGKLNLTLPLTRESILSRHGQIKPFSLGKPLVTTDISHYRHSNGTRHRDKVLARQGKKKISLIVTLQGCRVLWCGSRMGKYQPGRCFPSQSTARFGQPMDCWFVTADSLRWLYLRLALSL